MGITNFFQENWPAWQAMAGWPSQIQLVGVHLSALEIDPGLASPEAVFPWLSAGEQARFAGFTAAKRQREWLGGRLAAKMAVAGLRGEAGGWRSIEVRAGVDGRPAVLGGPHLSISHSGPLAAALAADAPCGLDVQQLANGLLRVRQRYAAPEEELFLEDALPGHPTLARLALLWAAKEAVRKLGLLGRPLPGLLATRLVTAIGNASPQAPLRLTLICPNGGSPAGLPLTVLALLSQGLAWAVCLAPQLETE